MLNRKALISLILGGVILATAATANFAASNGYEILKGSVRNIFDQTNYTFNGKIAIAIDSEELYSAGFTEQYDLETNAYVSKSHEYDATNKHRSEHKYERYYQDGMYIHYSSPSFDSNTGGYICNDTYYVDDMHKSNPPGGSFDKSNFISNDESELFDKTYNFGMTCLDMLVGDIKNNFVLVESQDGLSTYETTLDLFQIPEIVNSGADLIASQAKAEFDSDYATDFENEVSKIVFDPFVNSAACRFTVDEESRLTHFEASAEILGKDESNQTHSMTVNISFSMENYGTTVPEKIDLDGANIEFSSERERLRLKELETLLAGTLDDAERESYQHEYNYTKAQLEYFDANGIIDYDVVTFVENDDGSVVAQPVDLNSNTPVNTKEAPAAESVEVIVTEGVTSFPEENSSLSIGVIGGADGPTEIIVTP